VTNGPANFQRLGAVSNAHAGNEFEGFAKRYFALLHIVLTPNIGVEVGVGELKKIHRFDLGSENPAVIVECKSHNWTNGGNVPSAKIAVWNEAMFYFHLAPDRYRKILFTLKSVRRGESLASYYVRSFGHLIPSGVEVWEYDAAHHSAERLS